MTKFTALFISAISNVVVVISFTHDSQGELNETFENAKTPLENWKKALNGIKAEIIGVGEAILPTLTTLGNRVRNQISKLGYSIRTMYENIGYIFSHALTHCEL